MGSKSGGQAKQYAVAYYLSQHLGVCATLDWVSRVFYREKVIWSGRATGNASIDIRYPKLFGGEAAGEGGVGGWMDIMLGKSDQLTSTAFATKLGRTVATCPAFRGATTLLFRSAAKGVGFYWQSNNSYLGPVWVEGTRAPKGILPGIALVPREGAGSIGKITACVLTWWQSTFEQGTNDQARMGLRFLDQNGTEIGSSFATMTATAAGTWTKRTVSANAPAGTATLRVVMEMHRRSGVNNDGYIDDITLTVGGAAVSLDNPGAELGTAGWTGGVRARASHDVVAHSGGFMFDGGTSADTSGYQDLGIGPGPDANPAHIIYECLTDTDFGMGAPSTLIDVPSFEAAAQTLYDERLGLSLTWSRQTEIESFVQEILDHIEATLFINPRTGLFTLKLIRGDYDEGSLRILSPDNATLSKFQRKLWGDTINEIVVTYTNPSNENEETVTVHDIANIAMQGGIVSTARNYYGVRTAALATTLAYRDLRVAGAALASCDVEVDRSAWDLLPGDVVKVDWPEHGFTDLVMRVGPVNYGKPGDGKIKANLVEDVFALPTAVFEEPGGGEWEDPDTEPTAIDFVHVFTLPYFFAETALGADVPQAAEYPEVWMGVLAAEDGTGDAYELLREQPDSLGNPVYASSGIKNLVGRAALAGPLPAEVTSLVASFDDAIGPSPAAGSYVVIGETADTASEICLITAYDEVNYTLRRGVLDTVPRAWAAGTAVWFLTAGLDIMDSAVLAAGQTVNIKLLSITPLGQLDEADAPIESGTLNDRPHLPIRPADVTINGVAFGDVDAVGVDPIPVTWANRNRFQESAPVQAWDGGTITPEVGQTTTIIVKDLGGGTLTTHSGLTGTSFDVPLASFAGEAIGLVSVWAERDGLLSLQAHELMVTVAEVLQLEDASVLETEDGAALALE